uniref:Man1/Src1-like C-terminal domain-containing protein n=1 Tax=Timema shepardi TaxID=629360 RepID=A0A7R9G3N6_TIMSH|nr:unnamed protein product [Timema shepardi]
MVLLALTMIFFIALAVVYLNVRSGEAVANFSPENTANYYPLCNTDNTVVPCVKEETLAITIQLSKYLQEELTNRAVAQQCQGGGPSTMNHDQASHWLYSNRLTDNYEESVRSVTNVKVLMLANPQWGVSLVPAGPKPSPDQVIDTRDLVKQGGLTVLDPSLPLGCYLRIKLLFTLSIALVVAAGVGALYGLWMVGARYIRTRQRSKQTVFTLIQRIMESLHTHYSSTSDPHAFVIINHVRDQLLSPADRRALSKEWIQAVNYIKNHESRVRQESTILGGEEFEVWRWIAPNSSGPSSLSDAPASQRRNKTWQGQAFDTMAGSPNSLPISPTPCLKIRHMFDPDLECGDDWPMRVKDAILEKCDGIAVTHIQVDRQSREGLVYMKCATQEEAGRAYRALHGSWFDSKLVTVKYLRLERYYERFPGAARAIAPLKPSNNQKLSMPVHNWTSPMEAN